MYKSAASGKPADGTLRTEVGQDWAWDDSILLPIPAEVSHPSPAVACQAPAQIAWPRPTLMKR